MILYEYYCPSCKKMSLHRRSESVPVRNECIRCFPGGVSDD